jgi:hypothetical protein
MSNLTNGSVIEKDSSLTNLSVQLHPLVIMSISDHFTRLRVSNSNQRAVGALMGEQKGRTIDISGRSNGKPSNSSLSYIIFWFYLRFFDTSFDVFLSALSWSGRHGTKIFAPNSFELVTITAEAVVDVAFFKSKLESCTKKIISSLFVASYASSRTMGKP